MRQRLRGRGVLVAVLGLVLVSYGTCVVAALLDAPLGFAVAVLSVAVLEAAVDQRFAAVAAFLRRAQMPVGLRAFLLATMLVLLLVTGAGDGGLHRLDVLVAALLALAVPVSYLACLALLGVLRPRVAPPVEVRNVELAERFRAPAKPSLLVDRVAHRLFLLGVLPVLVVGALALQAGTLLPFHLAVAAYGVVVVGVAGRLVYLRLRLPPAPTPEEYMAAVSEALHRHRPEVALYHSGSASTTYQVDSWLTTLERMSRPAVVLLRERHTFRALQRTDVPVVCVPRAVDVMNLALPDLRVALYVANVGNDIHFLREPRVKHVFVGHGDSDKVGSYNPFSRVYDQIWVAGRAGRERYARARVGVRDDAVVEVGRPQLDGVRRVTRALRPTAEQPLTVLYVPTWEGWTDDEFQSSLTSMGESLVRRLLEHPVPVRVLYRPHPMTGVRDPRARAADARIRAMVAAAGDRQGPPDPQALDRLASLAQRMQADELSAAEERSLVARWNAEFWAAGRGRHLVVEGRLPGLLECFEQADLLVADVSGVLSDFVATGKPYAVANPKNLGDEEFRTTFPTAEAAYLLRPGEEDVDAVLAAVTGDDPLAGSRELARRHLLGPDEPPAIVRWDEALDRLIAAAEEEWEGQHGTGPALRPAAMTVDVRAEASLPRPRRPVDDHV